MPWLRPAGSFRFFTDRYRKYAGGWKRVLIDIWERVLETVMSSPALLTDAEILAEVVSPDRGDLEHEAARAILRLRFSDRQNERMRELADKNNRGVLTDTEQGELESYRRVGGFLALMQSKARISLQETGPSRD